MSKSKKSFKNLGNFKVFWEARRSQRRPQDAPRRPRDLYTEGHRDPQGAKESHRKPQGKIESHREGQRATESHGNHLKKNGASRSMSSQVYVGVVFLSFNRGFILKVQLQGCQTRQDAPRRPKRPLGAILTPQEASWSDLGRVWGGQDAPQDAPRRRQDGPRRRQDVPKTAKDGSKTPLRRVQMPPRPLKMQKC